MAVFTLGICMCERVGEDLGHGTGCVTFSSMASRHFCRNLYVFTLMCEMALHVHLGGE